MQGDRGKFGDAAMVLRHDGFAMHEAKALPTGRHDAMVKAGFREAEESGTPKAGIGLFQAPSV